VTKSSRANGPAELEKTINETFNSPLLVALIDDDPDYHREVRDAFQRKARRWKLRAFLQPEEALKKIPALSPDFLLLGTDLPGMTGIACAKMLRAVLPRLPVIFVAPGVKVETLLWYHQLPAQGYLVKSVTARALVAAVAPGMRGIHTVSDEASALLFKSVLPEVARAARTVLTARESEIMERVAQGWRDKDIGAALGIAPNTVHAHRTHAYRKLNAHGERDAVHKFAQLERFSPQQPHL
jgi:NarL family two-component system response regulator YdfI